MQNSRTDYASWDLAHLDREYSPSSCAHRPLDRYLEEYRQRSRMAREDLGGACDVSYGHDAAETLDLFVPATRARGLQVFFHGGYWSALSKDEFSYLARPFVDAGMAFASINYSLMPAVDLDRIVRQCRDALLWLAENASTFKIDCERMFLSGHSAGAHLAAMCLGTNWSGYTQRRAPSLGGACLISGIFDLAPLAHTSDNSVFRLTPDCIARNSPMSHLPAGRHSLVLTYGEQETQEFKVQTHAYAAACTSRGVRSTLLPMPGLDHFEAVSELGNQDSPVFKAALHQMTSRPARGRWGTGTTPPSMA